MSLNVNNFINERVAVIEISGILTASSFHLCIYCVQQRAQCGFLTKEELDLVLMGFVSSAILDSKVVKDGCHHNPAKCRHVTMGYKHHCVDVYFCMALERIVCRTSKTTTRRRAYKHVYTKTINAFLTCHAI